ncbi:glycoside hydrolase family 38 N-terminal domain-containing protein [Rhizomonospora bruguierae]|uniref:glycoside hydrolase family 38 N-terminal domain-containing protein n=1 Tax=Rhizomonospora bruguierae TaxID=1581705 RepID=UPI001BCCF03E|nr:glycoside hydrolase family 38 C-terminal domain-containing protein [Micromonospora sp. NBRC 107566]
MVGIGTVSSTDLFVGTEQHPLQIQYVRLDGDSTRDTEAVTVWIEGDGVGTPEPVTVVGLRAGEEREVEVAVAVDPRLAEGARQPVTVYAESPGGRARRVAELTVSAPGWTMIMVPHFHYDPFWWNTQAGYLATWDDQPKAAQDARKPGQAAAFELVRAHLDLARRDPDYKFVLSGLDYLKPFWDAHPRERAELRRMMATGRVELVGGMYNEPNTNLTALESTIRNILYGTRYQRDVVGSDPHIGWMLDVFGHDPALPAALADAGLAAVATARGPFHRWGPTVTTGDETGMQFPTEFEWIAPDGRGVLCGYLAHHYPAGWRLNEVDTLEEAEAEAYQRFQSLKRAAATRTVILPVGYNHVVPARWTTEVHRDWRKRYVWPRFVCGLPSEFFSRVRVEAARRGIRFSPQSRDMNPVYPGKDVSYIDVKQAHRASETALLDAERLATLASLLGAPFPAGAVDKAWRQLLFCAHHDGITGVASDQVYLDLAGAWREAYELATRVRRTAVAHLASQLDTRGDGEALVIVNAQCWVRTDLVRAAVEFAAPGPIGVDLGDDAGVPVPVVVTGVRRHADGTLAAATLTFVAADVPAGGYRVYRVLRGERPVDGWRPVDGNRVESEAFLIEADPARGGALSRVLDKRAGREVLRVGEVGASIVLDDEYADHPQFGKGPWHIVPTGTGSATADGPAAVRAEVSPAGQRVVATCQLGDLRVTTEVTLWHGLDRVEFSTRLDGSIGQDRLARVRFPLAVPGARPVYEVGNAVVGRTFGHPRVDVKEHPFTLDCPAHTWAGLSSTVRVALHDAGVPGDRCAIGVAEVVAARGGTDEGGGAVRDLVAALAAQGVTATTSRPEGARYGSLALDSNLPDVRVSVGGPAQNAFTARVLDAAEPEYASNLDEQLRANGTARLWIPAATGTPARVPGADLRGERALPVLVVAGRDDAATARAVADLVADLADATVDVDQPAGLHGVPDGERLVDYSVGVLNRGTPGAVVEPDGTLSVSLMRSCSGWPTGTWIDPPRRTTPDGSSFALQHWSHTFEYALVCGGGDWREAGFVRAGLAYNSRFVAQAEPGHAGPLPPSGASLLAAEPENVILTACKPAADALDAGREPGAGGDLVVRCYETDGRPTRARIRSLVPLRDAARADIRERPGERLAVVDGAVCLDLAAAATATVIAVPEPPHPPAATAPNPPAAEPAHPVFSRYWLHDKGAAPAGELPATVYLEPRVVDLAGPATVQVTVSSTGLAKGTVRLVAPPEVSVLTGDLDVDIHDGYEQFDVELRPAPDAPAGIYHLTARVTADGQTVEDVCAVRLGCVDGGDRPVAVTVRTPAVTVSAGGAEEIRVELGNLCGGEVRGEAQLITPFGTWDLIGPWTQRFRLEPGARTSLAYRVRVPPDTPPGAFWALVKVMAFGSVAYTASVPVTVRA